MHAWNIATLSFSVVAVSSAAAFSPAAAGGAFSPCFKTPTKKFSTTEPSCDAMLNDSSSHASASSVAVISDRSTLTLLEHVNLNVPNQADILPFYYNLLGCGMDPRKAENLCPTAAKKTLWANCGASQFHLPYGETAQRIPGHIGLRYDSLEPLVQRLKEQSSTRSAVVDYEIVTTDGAGGGNIAVVCLTDCYGNVFKCRAGPGRVDSSLRQPIIDKDDVDKWGDVATTYGCAGETECRGLDYVEFQCPVGTAAKISLFYESVLDATTSVVQDGDTAVAIIAFGNVDENGKADQSLLFRETTEPLPPYDGHHVAMYVGDTNADFEQAFKNADMAGVVWVNPRFSDKADTLTGAKEWKQFRFKDIIDMKTGQKIFELEHEMRSVDHEAWPGKGEL